MNRESIFPLAFYAVNKHLAISHCSQNEPVEFEIGTSTCSPKETFNHYNIERFCKFAKIERPRSRTAESALPSRHLHISLKVNGDRSETFVFYTKPGSDYIAVRCTDTKHLMSGYIDFKNKEECLAAMDGGGLCVEEPTVVMMTCGHAVFSPSGSPNVNVQRQAAQGQLPFRLLHELPAQALQEAWTP
ncbi:hypothetical protein M3Y99_00407000 [Aphelenchoides fujianensis]|nr:hypothetical protein M3Y99_00407000 [Aphelenchoides fujianensis]